MLANLEQWKANLHEPLLRISVATQIDAIGTQEQIDPATAVAEPIPTADAS